jgi:hypothetical protein
MPFELARITTVTSLIAFVIGLPTVVATYYQSFKAREEAKEARDGIHSRNCLEFVSPEGECINLVPLETLHTLPQPGDIVLLPGEWVQQDSEILPGAYRVESVEHIYAPAHLKSIRPRQAKLTKAVAKVTSLH